jgi:hypothetical protein
MSWTRYDDLFTERPEWDGVPYPVRWHYLALVQACSRQRRWDGVLPLAHARRASDVEDPDDCHRLLAAAGLLKVDETAVRLLVIDEHIPPTYVRDNAKKSKIRMRRMRAHRSGDHSLCLPDSCPAAPPDSADVTSTVTRNAGTGQDRTGQDWHLSHEQSEGESHQ